MFCPRNYKIVAGTGSDKYELVAFDKALINAGVSNYNLVKVSSILPVNCRYKEKIDIPEGSILYAAYATITCKNGIASAAVSISLPVNSNKCGVIFESSGNCSETEMKKSVIDMGINALNARNESMETQIVMSSTVNNSGNYFSVAFAAVVMW